jgi:hypothetical protein
MSAPTELVAIAKKHLANRGPSTHAYPQTFIAAVAAPAQPSASETPKHSLMILEELAYLSQIAGVIAVFGSLVFVGLQIRQNTKALKATSHHAVTDSFNAINNLIFSDPKLARLWRLGMAGAEGLEEDEGVSFNFMALSYMRIFETLYYQYSNGTLDKKLFDAELKTLKWSVTNPGFRAWWAVNPISLSAEFRTFIDGLIRDAQRQPAPHP